MILRSKVSIYVQNYQKSGPCECQLASKCQVMSSLSKKMSVYKFHCHIFTAKQDHYGSVSFRIEGTVKFWAALI